MDISSLIIILFNLYLILILIFLLLDNREPANTFSWFLLFIIFPIGGVLLYILIGRNWRKSWLRKRTIHKQLEESITQMLRPLLKAQSKRTKEIKGFLKAYDFDKLLNLLFNNSSSVLVRANEIKILQSGKEKFQMLKKDIEKAKSYIHMEYYQWIDDKLAKELKEILIRKAKEGIEVRIIFDTWGSFFLRRKYLRELRKAGVMIYPYFNFLSPLKFHTMNYRLHRKLIIIDGKIAYTGGMNIGQQYIDGGKRFKSWRDTHMRLKGEVVLIMQGIFAISWYNTTSKKLTSKIYYPETKHNLNDYQTYMQVTTSGPDSEWDSIRQLYFTLITSAKEKVFIQTPYFIPDQSVCDALKTAALSGVDVRVMMTGIPDKKIPFWAAQTFFQDLLQSGVKIYQYKKGFLHSKTVSIDSRICSIGTANMDIRSLKLSYEINTLIYDKNISQELEKTYKNDQKECKEITFEDNKNRNILAKLRNSFMRLFSPLL